MAEILKPVITLLAAAAFASACPAYAESEPAQQHALKLDKAQVHVWQGEVDYWDRVNARDLEGYLDLWHTDFTGWPCGAAGPADLSGLAEFAEGWFAGMAARGQRTVPTAEAVIVKDGFALTYLSADTEWREADGGIANKREKFVHSWLATPDGWKIIGGMCAPLASYDAAETSDPVAIGAIETAEERAALQAANRFLATLSSKNKEDYAASTVPEGRGTGTEITADGRHTVFSYTFEELVGFLPTAVPDQAVERLVDPMVRVDGDIAMVWGDYVFTVDGELSHCGTDHFDLLRQDGEWRVFNLTWTTRHHDCMALMAKPAAASVPSYSLFPADRALTHAEDGVVLPDGRLLVGDWDHGLVTLDANGVKEPFGDFAAAGFKNKPDPEWNSPNGVSFEPDGRHVLVADITGGHIYRVDTQTEAVTLIYDHPYGVNAVVRDPSGAIWFTQSTENEAGEGSEARMFAAADKPLGDGAVWRLSPDQIGKPDEVATKVIEGLDFANGIAFDAARGKLYIAEILRSRIWSFAVDPVSGALSERRILATLPTPDNIELDDRGMLWVASPFANAVYVVDPDTGDRRTVFAPTPNDSARIVAETARRLETGEPILPLLTPAMWGPMPGLLTGVILAPDGTAYVSNLGDALVKLDMTEEREPAQHDALTDFARRYAEAWSSQNAQDVASFYANDGRLVVNGGDPAVGHAEIAAVARGFMDAFPDMVVTFDRLGRNGPRYVFQWTLTGTNSGPEGTGNPVTISGTEEWLLGPDGLIADSVGTFDAAEYERQILGQFSHEIDWPDVRSLKPVLARRTMTLYDGVADSDVAHVPALDIADALHSPEHGSLPQFARIPPE
ncbi:MAG: SMP-30/gluconolactonase/LRE family protein [Pacificimonas sp.]|jgi:sugar lactone lactonase YvrE/ketosteroid isomerase-like protein|nr:SMP-30/gluconolactonase/LRE family protein [Pacificimonas sp.]